MAHVAAVERLGRYDIVRHLASGGMAEVLLARDPATGRHVVVKRIQGVGAEDQQLVRMFVSEARLAALLHHPNIVEVYDSGEDRGQYFFAMEYIHGEDLRNVLAEIHRRDDQLPIGQVLTLIGAAAAGLHHAHEARGPDDRPLGLVHRDVSPANILVGYDGRVKVTDFGVAKATLHNAETKSGTLKGKVSYMSPEQVTGAAMDRRSDIFSLGIVFYEVLTARRLFKNDNDFLTMSAIVQAKIPLPSQHRPDVPAAVEAMVMRALRAEPGERFATAEELRREIDRFSRSIGIQTSTNGVADYMKKLFGQRREPWLDADEPTQTMPIVDFDGSDSGLATPPPEFATPQQLMPVATSLIARAHIEATGLPLPPPAILPQAAELPAVPAPATAPSHRRWAIRVATAAGAVAIASLIALKMTGGKAAPAEPEIMQVAAPTPPVVAPPPAAEPIAGPAEPVAPPPPVERVARPVVAPSKIAPARPIVAKQPVIATKVAPPPKVAAPPVAAKVAAPPVAPVRPKPAVKTAPEPAWNPDIMLPPK